MENLRMRPKSDYMHTASLDELYVLTEHWKNELDFFKDEIHFLKDLIGKYFIMLTKQESIDKVQEDVGRLHNLTVRVDALEDKCKKHMDQIEQLQENPFSHDEQKFRNDHLLLEEELAKFVNDARDEKRVLFKVTEHVIEDEKLQHLLTT